MVIIVVTDKSGLPELKDLQFAIFISLPYSVWSFSLQGWS